MLRCLQEVSTIPDPGPNEQSLELPEVLPSPPLTVARAPAPLLVPGGWRIEGLPGTVREAGLSAERRLLEFFTAEISNPNTRLAYAAAAAPGGEAFNSGISVNENQRTNLGAFNFGGTPSSIQARIFDRFGTLVQAICFEMSPYSWSQKSIRAAIDNGGIRWALPAGDAQSSGGRVYLWAVMVDNRSNDGTLTWGASPTLER